MNTSDPVKTCPVYKQEGCSHVDGMLCDVQDCKILKDYLHTQEVYEQRIKNEHKGEITKNPVTMRYPKKITITFNEEVIKRWGIIIVGDGVQCPGFEFDEEKIKTGIEPGINVITEMSDDLKPIVKDDSIQPHTFSQRVIKIGSDGMCQCSCVDLCPLHKVGMAVRCTEQELNMAGILTERVKYEF